MTLQIKGILGEKLGMTQIFEETRAVPVTVIKAGPCFVAQVKTKETDGYDAVQLAFAEAAPEQADAGALRRSRRAGRAATSSSSGPTTRPATRPARSSRADVFAAGERADVVGVSQAARGSRGVMRRHGFAGLGSSHGTEKKHRSPGSIGACATPSRVFKGMRMAGQHGNQRITVLNLEVVQADAERNLLLVKGAVPGPNGGLVMVRSAVKAPATAGRAPDGFDRSASTTQGKKVGSRDLPADVFESTVSVPLMHQVVIGRARRASAPGTHSTKTRGEVSGGGKKPWRQKGTGRARQGSIRSPQWVGGGVAHGPHPHSHEMRVNKKMQRGALRSALTDALAERQARRGERARVRRAEDAARPSTCSARSGSRAGCSWSCPSPQRGRGEVVPQPARTSGSRTRRPRDVRVLLADRVLFTDAALGVLEGAAGVAA